MSKKNKVAHSASDETVARLSSALEKAFDYLKSYKSRQDDIVRGLGNIQSVIGSGAPASVLIADLLARDLKQAKDRTDNHAFALDMAIKTLERYTAHRDVVDVLSQLEILVPEAFGKSLSVASNA